jgi:hypothetical protein
VWHIAYFASPRNTTRNGNEPARSNGDLSLSRVPKSAECDANSATTSSIRFRTENSTEVLSTSTGRLDASFRSLRALSTSTSRFRKASQLTVQCYLRRGLKSSRNRNLNVAQKADQLGALLVDASETLTHSEAAYRAPQPRNCTQPNRQWW